MGELKSFYNHEHDAGITALFDYIARKGYGFYTSTPQYFPPLDLSWASPFPITNAVIEAHNWDISSAALSEIVGIGCQAIALIFLAHISLSSIEQLFISKIKHSQTSYASIYMPYNETISRKDIEKILIRNQIISNISLLVDCKQQSIALLNELPTLLQSRVQLVDADVLSLGKNTTIFANKNFVVNVTAFSEAQKYNLGQNRRVCIDRLGRIKNDLSHTTCFGQVGVDRVAEVLRSSAFRQKWTVAKDKVQVCCDCQYRYMCVDFTDIEFVGGKWHRVEACRFNPHRNSWHSGRMQGLDWEGKTCPKRTRHRERSEAN